MKMKKGRVVTVSNVDKSVDKKVRKTRSDKKRDIKPTISIEVKDHIYRLSYIMTLPVKDVCELMIKHAIKDESIINRLSKNFQRGIWFNETLFHGSSYNQPITKFEYGPTDRISFRTKKELHDKISALSYSLDCSISRTCAVLLYESLTDREFVNNCVVDCTLDASRSRELRFLYTQLIFR